MDKETKLFQEREKFLSEIEKSEKNILKLERDIKKEEKIIVKYKRSLDDIENKIKNYKLLSKEAFVFCLNNCDNNVDLFMNKFNFEKDQMIQYYNENKTLSSLRNLIDYMILTLDSEKDLQNLIHISLTNTYLLEYTLRKNKNRKEFVYLIGLPKILDKIKKYKRILEDPQTFNPFNRLITKTSGHYVNKYIDWCSLLQYFNAEDIPEWVTDVPHKIRELADQKELFSNITKEKKEEQEAKAREENERREANEKANNEDNFAYLPINNNDNVGAYE